MNKQIGRFEIIRELGRGTQSVVYLARDPRLQREVAIKTLHFTHPDPRQNQQLLVEARLVAQLRHANIVPIFEVGEEKGDLYLVFEYVAGNNLGEYLKASGGLPPVRAIAIMQPILDAITHAHGAGIIHRDLKPSNILINDDGIPRVMDFGIAAYTEGQSMGSGGISGTPAYMAPEYITRRESNEQTDVFSAGLVFYELLTGRQAARGGNALQVMNKLANEDISLPKDGSVVVDERISSVLLKAVARDPQNRYASAAQMREAFEAYLEPPEFIPSADAKQGTIDFLLRRMRHKSDFPALSESVSAVNKLTGAGKESISQLANSILKDFSLTNKMLRLVNSAYYRHAGGGSISTVSRAVMVLGFDAVRNIAISVMLFDHLQDKANAAALKDEFLRANLAAILARDIGIETSSRDVEQVFICSMFHNLGRLLSQYYFPDETEEVRRIMLQKPCGEEMAAKQVLGISFEDLGVGIARTWGFPSLIVNSMRKLPPGLVRCPATVEERLRVLSAFSNELCKVIASATPEQRAKELSKLAARFGESVDLTAQSLQQTMEKSFEEVAQFASIIHLNLQQTPFGRQIRAWGGYQVDLLEEAVPHGGDAISATVLPNTVLGGGEGSPSVGDASGPGGDTGAAEEILMAGIQDISNALVEDFKLNDVLRIILETIYRAKGFKRVILCTLDARSNTMVGRLGFGRDAVEVARRFNFSLVFSPDIFHVALSKGVDILISDTHDEKISTRLPEWFRKGVGAETFVLFPLRIKGSPVAMIYAERDKAGEIVISEKELSLLRTLRNQAVLAIKQSS